MSKSLSGPWLAADLDALFADCFGASHNTFLQGGGEEPIYLPEDDHEPNRIVYTRDYFRSALHEIAHWCVAGEERRKLVDYGYWYAPDGRNLEQQAEFERLEVYPQALELIFCAAAGHPFRVSLDNLTFGERDTSGFAAAVLAKATQLLQGSLAERPRQWALALARFYREQDELQAAWLTAMLQDQSVG